MDKDSIKEFLENRYKELSKDDVLPPLKKKNVEQEIEKPIEKKSSLRNKRYYILGLFFILGILYFGNEVYQRWNVNQSDQNEVLLMRLRVLTELPGEEVPTIATVTNANMVRNQLFFKEAMNGDKVVIYRIAKKAILYRPSTDKVISIAPIN